MSDRSIEEVAREVGALAEAASSGLGVTIDSPFMQLSFLGLSVLPELRITDKGLVDVGRFELVPEGGKRLEGPSDQRLKNRKALRRGG